jgi:predicted dehydrogenase
MADPVSIGFIGTGGIAGHHLKELAALGPQQARVVALCDLLEERAQAVAADFEGARAFADHRRMFDEVGDSLDAVYVCVPPFAHDDAEQLAAERGLHLFVEKPVVLDFDLGLANMEAIRAAGVLSSVGYTLRYRHPWRTARDLLHERDVSMICADRWGGMSEDEGSWWRVQEKSGGQLHEQTTHQVDAMRWIAGDVTEVYACYGRRVADKTTNMTVPDSQVVTLQFASDAVGYVSNVCTMTKGGGRSGMQVIMGDCIADVGRELTVRPEEAIAVPTEVPAYESIDAAFVRAVASGDGAPILCDYREGLKSAAISLAANESEQTGRPVSVWQGE